MKELADIGCGTAKEAIATLCYTLNQGYSFVVRTTPYSPSNYLGLTSFAPPLVIYTAVVGERSRADHTAIPGVGYVKSTTYGKDLADYIAANSLGKVTEGPVVVNPITNNKLQLFVYLPDYDELKKWWVANWQSFRILDGPDPENNRPPDPGPPHIIEVREVKDGETAGIFAPTPTVTAASLEAQVNAAPPPYAVQQGRIQIVPAPAVAERDVPFRWASTYGSSNSGSAVAGGTRSTARRGTLLQRRRRRG